MYEHFIFKETMVRHFYNNIIIYIYHHNRKFHIKILFEKHYK